MEITFYVVNQNKKEGRAKSIFRNIFDIQKKN